MIIPNSLRAKNIFKRRLENGRFVQTSHEFLMSRSQQPNRPSSQRYSPTSPNRFSWKFSVPVHSTSEIFRFSGLVVNAIEKSSVPLL